MRATKFVGGGDGGDDVEETKPNKPQREFPLIEGERRARERGLSGTGKRN